jgi:hypothetical protein
LFEPWALRQKHLDQLSEIDSTVKDPFSKLVIRSLTTHRLVTAKTKGEITDALNAAELLRKDMQPVELEHFDYQVANLLFAKHDTQAVKYLKRVDEFNTSYAGLMREAKQFVEK